MAVWLSRRQDGWFRVPSNKSDDDGFYDRPPPHQPGTPYLFDLTNDPNERTDLSLSRPELAERGAALLASIVDSERYCEPSPNVPRLRALPSFNGGVWGPWQREDEENSGDKCRRLGRQENVWAFEDT